MERQLSESLEDYLEAIAELIAVEGHAHSKNIAERLNVTMPSVTGALRQLDQLGFIVYNIHYPVQLTAAGKAIADRVIHRHAVLKKFFSEILGLAPGRASETACHLEHVVDEDTIRRFVLFSEAIENRTDAKQLQTYLTEAMDNLGKPGFSRIRVLSEISPGMTAAVERFGRNLRDPGRFGLKPGASVTLQGVTLDRTGLRVLCGRKTLELSLSDAENIWVKLPEEKR